MIKKNKLFPEKLLLMLSGCAFVFLITPAWVQGFAGAAVSAVLLCLTVWQLPLTPLRIRELLRRPYAQMISLLLGVGFGCNFYNTWQDSRYVQRIAGFLGLKGETFLLPVTAAVVLLTVPAVSGALAYFAETVIREYRAKKLDRTGKGIPLGKAVWILFAIYAVGISAILRADYLYRDDFGRAAFGYKQWDYFSRYLSTALATLVHGGDYLVDISPVPQLLAMLIMALAGVLMLYILCDRTEFTLWELVALVPMGLSPYFLECISYRFDAPYMAVSVLAAVVPLLLRRDKPVVYFFASMLGTLAVCTSYQAATGIFPMLVIALMLQMWNQGKSLKDVFTFCGISAAGYVLGMVFFLVVIMRPADAGYVSNSIPEAANFLTNALNNLKQYFTLVRMGLRLPRLLLAALIGVIYLAVITADSCRKKPLALAVTALGAAMMTVLCFGIYPFLAAPVTAPRAMYGFGVLISIFAVAGAQRPEKLLRKLPVLVLSWLFVVFSLTYGNALSTQKEYADFRIQMVVEDLKDMDVFLGEEPVRVQLSGTVKRAPILYNLPKDTYKMLDFLLPVTFGGADEWARYGFYYYYDLQNVFWDKTVDLRKQELPVVKDTMYHTIRAEGTSILIELK